jgi:membrane peptidoglycan carboxypeptidase
MRAHGREGTNMGKRFAILIGVAAAGVMAVGAQTATSTTGPVEGKTGTTENNGDAWFDLVPPHLKLSGDKTQNPQQDRICDRDYCDVIVKMRCRHQACTTRARGRLTNVRNDRLSPDGPIVIRPGKTIRGTGPELARKAQRRQVRKALRKGKNVKAKVTVRAKDAAGNVATAKRTITLVQEEGRHG